MQSHFINKNLADYKVIVYILGLDTYISIYREITYIERIYISIYRERYVSIYRENILYKKSRERKMKQNIKSKYLLPQSFNSSLIIGRTSDKSKLRDILWNTWTRTLQKLSLKKKKQKNLRNCQSPEDMTTTSNVDAEQEMGFLGKWEIQIKSGNLLILIFQWWFLRFDKCILKM